MKLYRKFRNSSLDTAPLGLWSGPDTSDSVYTPTGSRIVAWEKPNGIHFCQVEGFGSMVFAVDPSAPPGDCIHPVAKDIPDLLALVMTCRHASIISRAYRWSRALFDRKISAVHLEHKTRSILRALENTYHPPLIRDPYGYIAAIQQEFDYDLLPLHPDYFEWCPIRPGALKWDVGYGNNFFDYCDKSQAGQELALRHGFRWHEEQWAVASVYLCEQGIVVDSYLQVSGDTMERFDQKWGSKDPTQLSIEEQMRRTLEDPLSVEARGSLFVNDKPVPLKHSYLLRWDPLADNCWNARRTLEHYGMDRSNGYLLRRECFLRKGKNPPIRTMDLKLEAAPVAVPGQRFIAPRTGESMSFTHPATGQVHTLTVTAQTREALDPNFLSNHPCCYTRLSYALEPPISKEAFSIVDCDPGDRLQTVPEAPAAMLLTGKIPSAGAFAISSLRHKPAETVTWRMIFRQKLRQDVTVKLLR